MQPIEYISRFSRLGKRVSDLSRMGSLLDAIGRPQEGQTFIHIAGTNGKGSIAQMFSEVLTAQGYRAGLFTSPYIVSFYDRIKVDNKNITEAQLSDILEGLAPVIEAHPMCGSFSQFEITQAAAFVHFRRQGCRVVVLEAGLGGLLDSTNIIEKPLVSVIGSIGLDHTAILGDTVAEIAFQKAGIIKEGAPCVLSAGAPEDAVRVFETVAARRHSQLVIPDMKMCRIIRSGITGSDFLWRGKEYSVTMPGQHQVRNALTVIEALRLISDRLPVSFRSLRQGLERAQLFGRVEILSKEPLTVLDGSHNPDGMRALGGFLSQLGGRTVRAVIGMHTDKNAAGAVAQIAPYVSAFYPVSGFSDRDYPAGELADIITAAGGKAELMEGEPSDVISALRQRYPEDVLLICGSLYLVSYVKQSGFTG
ncbi:MAG: bifunctional folylpolyglutamate synthase/dihydrofolate synthase [Ruminococcus sp.]|nr:bifunctional folylpolyglutamate synthase/dihydrofolate synthase [Ruminococcus sp.]